jgi:hypothetical protein
LPGFPGERGLPGLPVSTKTLAIPPANLRPR